GRVAGSPRIDEDGAQAIPGIFRPDSQQRHLDFRAARIVVVQREFRGGALVGLPARRPPQDGRGHPVRQVGRRGGGKGVARDGGGKGVGRGGGGKGVGRGGGGRGDGRGGPGVACNGGRVCWAGRAGEAGQGQGRRHDAAGTAPAWAVSCPGLLSRARGVCCCH